MDRTATSSAAVLLTGGLAIGILSTLAAQKLLSPCDPKVPISNDSRTTILDDGTYGTEDIRKNLTECVGNTPLLRINSLSDFTGCEILGKCEFLNPGGSIKDRVASHILTTVPLPPHSTLYEGTVGSTGLSLTTFSLSLSHRTHIILPSDQSQEKISLLRKLGATVELVPPAPIVDPNHFVNLSERRAADHTAAWEAGEEGVEGKGYFVDQFENNMNYEAHEKSTGPEIWRQCGGRVDAFVAGAGTGGTISGVARYLHSRQTHLPPNERTEIVLADPEGSGLYNKVRHGVMFDLKEREGTRRRHQVDTIVEGIGCNRLTANFAAGLELVGDAVRVTDKEAMAMAKLMVEREGLFLGSSSCVNLVASLKTALRMKKEITYKEGGEPTPTRIVTILCDSGTRHLSKFWKEVGDVGGRDGRPATTVEDVLNASVKTI
ncbi:PALP-domain-containing protein [Ascodesmis nigricans]|uniref:Cysteine synthase 2 n=1 Tax=Ascodesmis nigricans TaxID=341454 RepID=A0A4S2N8A4_9PEZI|nr:PALP-domain-containing protein [Ascodesmis nigricans]